MKLIGSGIFRINSLSARVDIEVYYDGKKYKVIVAPTSISTIFIAKSRDEIISRLYKISEDKKAFYDCLKLDIDESRYYEKKEENLVTEIKEDKSSFTTNENMNHSYKKESKKSTSRINTQSKIGQSFLGVLIFIGLYFLGQYDESKKTINSKPIYDFDESLKTLDFNSFKILNKDEIREIASSIKVYGDPTLSFYKTVHENVEGVCVESKEYYTIKRCSYGLITIDKFLYFFEINRKMKIVDEIMGEKLLLVENDFIENKKLKEIINKLLEIDPYFQFYDKSKKVYMVNGLFNKVDTDKDISYLALRKELYDDKGNIVDINYLNKNKIMLDELQNNVFEVKKLIEYVEKNNGLYIYPNVKDIEEFKKGIEKSIRHYNYDIGQFKIFMNQPSTTLKDKNFYIKRIQETKNQIEKLKNTLKLISEYK